MILTIFKRNFETNPAWSFYHRYFQILNPFGLNLFLSDSYPLWVVRVWSRSLQADPGLWGFLRDGRGRS